MPWEQFSAGEPWTLKAAGPQPPVHLHLTAKESALLRILATDTGEPVSIEALLSKLYPNAGASKNTIEVHIHNLRKKMRLCAEIRIDTVLNQGYMLIYADPPLA
jgi:DNA-binding response OmpR family regulator